MMAVVAGALLAVAVAVAVSPLSPRPRSGRFTRAGGRPSTSPCSVPGRPCSWCAPVRWRWPWPPGPCARPAAVGQAGPGTALGHGPAAGPHRSPRARPHWRPLCPRAGPGPYGRSRAVGAAGQRAGRGHCDRHLQFCQRPLNVGLPSPPLRLELGLCPSGLPGAAPVPVPVGQGPLWWRPGAGSSSPTSRSTARPCPC